MPKQVVIFTGPPTSGKGTQALWLENEAGFVHLESTPVIREQFALHPDDPVIIDQKAKVARGDIVDPPVILEWMKDKVRVLAGQGKDLALSGSPRSRFEAEGDEKQQGLYPLFDELYGPQNVHNIYLRISEEDAVRRSLVRRVCEAQGHPIPDLPEYRDLTDCPWDGSKLMRRTDGLDNDEKIIRKRYRDYMGRMAYIMAYLRERGYEVLELDGNLSIEAIHHAVIELLERRRMPVPAK